MQVMFILMLVSRNWTATSETDAWNCTEWLTEAANRSAASDAGLDDDMFSDPSYYSRDYRIVGTLFQGLILLVGVLGNLLVVLVRSFHHL